MDWEQLNNRLFLAINAGAGENQAVDGAARLVASYLPLAFIGVLIYLWLRPESERRRAALHAGYAASLALGVNLLITLTYFHPRPFMEGLGRELIPHAPETSFPSDHSTFMLAIASRLLLDRATRWWGVFLFPLGVLGGLARVFCGVHFPFDIAGSLVVGAATAAALWLARGRLTPLDKAMSRLLGLLTPRCLRPANGP